jgi:hypothetical protein
MFYMAVAHRSILRGSFFMEDGNAPELQRFFLFKTLVTSRKQGLVNKSRENAGWS